MFPITLEEVGEYNRYIEDVAEWSRMLDTGLSKVLEVAGNLKDEVGGY
jgi:hypothetical protein